MIPSQNKPYYKVISLFIKSAILFFSFYYIYDKLNQAPLILSLSGLFSTDNWLLTISILLLMFLNWGIETWKWKLLVSPLEKISFGNSLKGVLSGITISIFTPNRIGEFAGRVFFLEKADKLQATMMSLIGSFIQLAVTVIAGIFAFFFLEKKYYDFFQTEQFISTNALLLFLILIVLIAAALVFVLKRRSEKFKKYTDIFKIHSSKSINAVINLSLLRYSVFSLQYYLALKVFGINGGEVIVFALIALTFFVTSVIPTFAMTEIATRSGVAIYFFGMISDAHAPILAASLFLWIINLALPALVGAVFVRKLNFFKV